MFFDPNNPIVKLCAEGMVVEGQPKLALVYYLQAWNEAANSEERFIAAHYLARVQATVAEKLKWDQVALTEAISVDKEYIKLAYPSLYLNIGKCFEDLADFVQSEQNYLIGLSFSDLLTDEGYGNMIRSGLERGMERVLIWKK